MRYAAAISCLPLIGCATSSYTPTPATPAVRAAIVAANQELTDRYNRADYPGVARMYEDDAVMISGPERHAGRQAIDNYWAPPNRPPNPAPHWDLTVLSVEGTPEMPIQRGRSILTSERDGKPYISDVQFIAVWRRQPDGSYRIAVDSWWRTP